MTIGIYSIRQVGTSRRYIGKSRNIESRFWVHKNYLRKSIRPKDCNRFLYAAVQKHGLDKFKFEILEKFESVDEVLLADRELYWMQKFKSHEVGFNLRLDSSTRTIVHEKTRQLMSEIHGGSNNANFGNHWNKDQRARMSQIAKERHASGKYYGEEWKRKQGVLAKKMWLDPAKRRAMGIKVKIVKRKFAFVQFSRVGKFIRVWGSVEEIVGVNIGYKWQNIYSVCNGYKPTYMGFIWSKIKLKDFESAAKYELV
jgi:group I intron endonuclease